MIPQRITRTGLAITFMAVLVATAACAPPDTTTRPTPWSGYQRPANARWTEHWTPTPVVDLNSPDGTFIRAFAEARTIAELTGSTATGTYPGFASADRTDDGPLAYAHGMPTWTDTGFASHSILSLTRTGTDTATATVCAWESINSLNREFLNEHVETLTYHRTGTPPPENQHGPRDAPIDSVFGHWYATKYERTWGPGNPSCDNAQIVRSTTPTPGWPTTETADQ